MPKKKQNPTARRLKTAIGSHSFANRISSPMRSKKLTAKSVRRSKARTRR